MKLTSTTGGCWPTSAQETLLEAAVLNGDSARHAWERWHSAGGLDNLDFGTFRLLPYVFKRMSESDADAPSLNTLRGIYRRAWCENQILFRKLKATVAALQANDIPVLLLKGAALTLQHYRDRGARPMQDFDVLVPETCALEAISVLEQSGWKLIETAHGRLTRQNVNMRASAGFQNGSTGDLDLHWHVLDQACKTGSDAPFWAAARPIDFEGIAVQTLCPADQLLHVCVHGLAWNPIPPVRWVVDAHVVIQTGEVDWTRIVETAANLRVTLPVGDALAYLRDRFSEPIPATAVRRLREVPVTRVEQAEYARLLDPDRLQTPLTDVLAFYSRFRRTGDSQSIVQRASSFIEFARMHADVTRVKRFLLRSLRWGATCLHAAR